MNLLKHEMIFILIFVVFMIINFWFKSESKPLTRFIIPRPNNNSKTVSELQRQVNNIFDQMDKMFPKVNLIHKDNTSCARNSRATIMNPKKKYCVGDTLIVRVEMFDYLKKRKKYGGDYLVTRISSPDIEAGAAGKAEDLKNGTYHVYFTLFWEGKIMVSLFLFHPSEGASALMNARNRWYGYTAYTGIFTNKDQQMVTQCGFEHDNSKELCEYGDHRDEEYFYCVKPANYSCDSLTEIKSHSTKKSNLTEKEAILLEASNIGVEIPNGFGNISVFNCSKNVVSKERCRIGMKLERPAGHFLNNTWYPRSCSMQTYRSMEELNNCLTGKFIHTFGDSTLRQWSVYLQEKLTNLKMMNLYEDGWAYQHLGIDLTRNIMFRWKRHTFPFITTTVQSYKEERTITREIDLIGGNQHTVVVLNIGVHFRPHPLHLFIRRLLNIRRAVERLHLRSPQTKVIIKTENSDRFNKDYEVCGDFHGYVQYLIFEQVFKDANVGFVNGWDMTRAFDAKLIHPPTTYIQNEVDLLMTYIC